MRHVSTIGSISMRLPELSKKCPSLSTMRSALTLASSSASRSRAVELSIGPPFCALVGKKAAPSQRWPEPANIVLISAQSTSSPMTCRYVEHSGATRRSPISVSKTSAVNSPCCRTMPANLSSKSVPFPLISALDKGELLDVPLEQHPKRLLESCPVPGFEVGERLDDMIGGPIPSGCRKTCKSRLNDGREPSQGLCPRLAFVLPAEFGAPHDTAVGAGGLPGFGRKNAAAQCAHEIEAPVGKGPFALEAEHLCLHLPAHCRLGFARRACCLFEGGQHCRCRRWCGTQAHCCVSDDAGGGGWESNPPATV